MMHDRANITNRTLVSRSWEARIILALFAFGIIASIVLELGGWDLGISSLFFVPGGAYGGWAFSHNQPWNFLYDYGEFPPIILGLAAVWLYRAAQSERVNSEYAKPCLVVILTLALGPGLLVNGILKEDWGRPRPADITVFGGSDQYRKVWEPGKPGVAGNPLPAGIVQQDSLSLPQRPSRACIQSLAQSPWAEAYSTEYS